MGERVGARAGAAVPSKYLPLGTSRYAGLWVPNESRNRAAADATLGTSRLPLGTWQLPSRECAAPPSYLARLHGAP
eukprot:3306084-Rhodomonas_salina.1